VSTILLKPVGLDQWNVIRWMAPP